MQSQLQAALLGHGGNTSVAVPTEDDVKNEQEDEGEDIDEFIDEELEGDSGQRIGKIPPGNVSASRAITLQMLLSAGILEPGYGTMTIEYLGQRFVGDLLEGGKIRSQETDIVFASPSAWAIACKRFINPDKKSGCGWASIKYRGKKLDAYKNIWYKKKKEYEENVGKETNAPLISRAEKRNVHVHDELERSLVTFSRSMALPIPHHRIVVKHNTIANRTFTHDANTLIECVPFSNLGKIQPFLVSLSTNAALLMDFHSHLTKSEVCGYLAGHWDINSHNLQVTHAFPCRSTKADRENANQVESEISKTIEKEQLTLVGWYHSHPLCAAAPTLRDIDAQLDYQIKMKGNSDNSYTPCIGIIVSPYNYENVSLESNIIAYWVIPPPEAKPNEYGRPMLMSYSVVQDAGLPTNIKDEMRKCVDYYKNEKDYVQFLDKYVSTSTYIEKLKATLSSKFPRDENETNVWTFIRDILSCNLPEQDIPISIPSLSKTSQILSSLGTSVSLNSNLMMNSDLANVLFNSGKFTSTSSLFGIPDPLAQSTLAANSMFLSPNLFKMQDLLKPLSTSSPLSSKPKLDIKSTPLKIPSGTDIKAAKFDSSLDSILNKNKFEFSTPELSMPKYPRTDFSASDLSISSVKTPKVEFSVADLSVSSVRTPNSECSSINLSKHTRDYSESSKINKTDYPMLDLSMPSNKSLTEALESMPSDLSVTRSEDMYALNALIESATGNTIADKERFRSMMQE